MSLLYTGVAVLLFVTLLGVLVWRVRAPTLADRLLAASFSGSLVVAFLLLVAEARGMPVLEDVALVFAVLAAVAVSTCALRLQAAEERAR